MVGSWLRRWRLARVARGLNRRMIESLERAELDLFALPCLSFRVPPPTAAGATGLELPAPPSPAELPSAEGLGFASLEVLAGALRARRLSPAELTEALLARLKAFGPKLECVVATSEETARRQAAETGAQIAAGDWRGWLHGIPHGLKDIFATRGAATSWGAAKYRDQQLDRDAAVVERLGTAGSIQLARLSLDELAEGTSGRWFGGMARNPWNTEESAGGSSGGPAAAVAAGLVPFAIGSETLGSILLPASLCGVLGLRPTFGRISRYGALCGIPSMDKIGVLARHALDAAVVLGALSGADRRDPATLDAPLRFDGRPLALRGLRLGIDESSFAAGTERGRAERQGFLEALRAEGVELVPLRFPGIPPAALLPIKTIETVFTNFHVRNRPIDRRPPIAARIARDLEPGLARLPAAIDYLELYRLRSRLIEQTAEMFEGQRIDLYLTSLTEPGAGGEEKLHHDCLRSNLSGLPALALPVGLAGDGLPESVIVTAAWWREDLLLALAHAWQQIDGFHRRRPPGF